MIASRSDGYRRYSHTNSKRSMFHSLARVGDLRRRTISCWHRMRFSAKAALAAQAASGKQTALGQKRDHRSQHGFTFGMRACRTWLRRLESGQNGDERGGVAKPHVCHLAEATRKPKARMPSERAVFTAPSR